MHIKPNPIVRVGRIDKVRKSGGNLSDGIKCDLLNMEKHINSESQQTKRLLFNTLKDDTYLGFV